MKRLGIAAVGLMLLLTMGLPLASAETFTTLWEENFDEASEWNFHPHFFLNGNPPYEAGFLYYSAQDGAGSWEGPNFRVTSDVWHPHQSPVLNLTIDNMKIADLAGFPDPLNMQVAFKFEDTGSRSPIDDNSGDSWFQLKLISANCCGVQSWDVQIMDEGVVIVSQDIPIGFDPTQEEVSEGINYEIDANLTINLNVHRYWLNWSIGPHIGAFTGTWTPAPDGPFDSNSVELTMWAYSNTQGSVWDPYHWKWDYLALSTNETGGMPEPSPPSEPGEVPKEESPDVVADFAFNVGLLGTQFFDRSAGPGKIVQWDWFFGDDYGSRKQDPFHAYACAGTYEVTLQVTDEFGHIGSVRAPITVKEDRPSCGFFQRSEEGVTVGKDPGVLIPTAFFIVLLIVSASSLAFGIEINYKGEPLVSRQFRWLLVAFSVIMLLFTLGIVGAVANLLLAPGIP